MNDRKARALLYATAVTMTAVAILFWLDRPSEEWRPAATTAHELARTLANHPTDWRAASALSEHVIDEESPRRVEAWRAAHALASTLAPHIDMQRVAYARGGLFHWLELSESDRRDVLEAIRPMMRDPVTYARMGHSIFELTGDLRWLRQANPGDLTSLRDLRDLAAMYGRFQEYRELRKEETAQRIAEFSKRVHELEPSQIVAQLPPDPRKSDEPMLVTALAELQRRPLEDDPNRSDILDALIGYADRHRLRPLDGLRGVVAQKNWASDMAREQLAQALGDGDAAAQIAARAIITPKESVTVSGVTWIGTCGVNICRDAYADVNGPLPIELESAKSDEVPPYVEIYVDDTLAAEGPVRGRGTLAVVPAGRHRVEINVANRLTRNREIRSVRID